MKTMWTSITTALFCVLATAALAEGELPAELLLRCELKVTLYFEARGKNELHESKEVKDFRLKDGAFGSTNSPTPLGKNCKLIGNQIVCKLTMTSPTKDMISGRPRTEWRESSVLLNRSTGEINTRLDTKEYVGEVAKGTPDIRVGVSQLGVCRTVGKPLL